MDSNNQQTVEVTVTFHQMTEEEVKQAKLEQKERRKKYRQEQKEKSKEARKLKNNFITMNSCMIHPSNVKIGCLEECIHSNHVVNFAFMGTAFGHIEEECVPIKGEKVLIQIKPDSDLYFDLEEIRTNKDLLDIRRRIDKYGITLGGKILSCSFGKIRVIRNSLQGHPYFEATDTKEPISIKQLKKLIEETRK